VPKSRITNDEDDDGRGCAFVVGLVIVGICVGNIYTPAAGWLVIGVGLIIIALV
jgi:hypothetical protein